MDAYNSASGVSKNQTIQPQDSIDLKENHNLKIGKSGSRKVTVGTAKPRLNKFTNLGGKPGVKANSTDAQFKTNKPQKKLSQRKIAGFTIPSKMPSIKQAKSFITKHIPKNSYAKKVDKWFNPTQKSSPLAKAFNRAHPDHKAKDLSETDSLRLKNFMLTKMQAETGMLTKQNVQDFCEKHLSEYKTSFESFAPSTAEFLSNEIGTNVTVGEDLQEWVSYQTLSTGTKYWVGVFSEKCEDTECVLEASPHEKRANASFKKQGVIAKQLRNDLQKTSDRLASTKVAISSELKNAMLDDIKGQLIKINSHIEYLETLDANDFIQKDTFVSLCKRQLNTAMEVLDKNISEASQQEPSSLKDKIKLTNKATEWKRLKANLEKRSENIKVPRNRVPYDVLKRGKCHQKSIQRELKLAGVSSKKIKKQWEKAWVVTTNSSKWAVINKEIVIRQGGATKNFTSTITPANAIRLNLGTEIDEAKQRDPFENGYEGGACASTTKDRTDHALNLHQTVLSSSSGDNAGESLFQGIRSGTVACQKIKDPALRQEAKINWAKEIVTAALVQKVQGDPSLASKIESGEKIPLRLTSTSLLTSDIFRHKTKISDDEYKLQQEQYEALHILETSNEPITIYDSSGSVHKVNVDLKVATFNVGVNALSLDNKLATVMQSREQADVYTKEGLDVLIGGTDEKSSLGGWVGEWLQDNPDHPKHEIVEQLGSQIRHIYNNKLHHTEGQDGYKLMTRIQILSYLIDAVPHFNCKSGKDRTGEADASIKTLATEIDHYKEVPNSEAPWSTEKKERQLAMMSGAGEAEVLMLNTGDYRFKTGTGKQHQDDAFKYLHHT